MVISIHVPKCAGTSFKRILGNVCGARIWFNYGTIFSRDQAKPYLVPEGTRFIHGHFLADAFDDLFPDRQLITWVRHPVQRVVSNYYHFKRSPDMRDECCKALYRDNLSLARFSELEWMRNEATRYHANKDIGEFAFVGVTERFKESVDKFCDAFGFRSVARIPRENLNPDRSTLRYEISQSEFDHILAQNEADFAWYEKAVDRLESGAVQLKKRIA